MASRLRFHTLGKQEEHHAPEILIGIAKQPILLRRAHPVFGRVPAAAPSKLTTHTSSCGLAAAVFARACAAHTHGGGSEILDRFGAVHDPLALGPASVHNTERFASLPRSHARFQDST